MISAWILLVINILNIGVIVGQGKERLSLMAFSFSMLFILIAALEIGGVI